MHTRSCEEAGWKLHQVVPMRCPNQVVLRVVPQVVPHVVSKWYYEIVPPGAPQ
jgi:hypothetical protein